MTLYLLSLYFKAMTGMTGNTQRYNASVIILMLAFFFLLFRAGGQNAPVTTAATVNGATSGTITVPITVVDFNNIGSITLTLRYDHSSIQFVQGIQNPAIPGSFLASDEDLGNGTHQVLMGWLGWGGVNLPDGSTIMTLEFDYISGSTPLEWFDNGPSCEYTDGSFNSLNDIPTEDYYINGAVCGPLPAPGTITGPANLCQGESGINYSIDPVPEAISYVWNVPEGFEIIAGDSTTSITVNIADTASSGNVEVAALNYCGEGPFSQLAVTVNELPYAFAGNDTVIPYGTSTTLNAASGGSGTYSYLWSPDSLLVDPTVQNPQTIILEATAIFTVVVTDEASSCSSSDDVVVTITGGPLSCNPVAIPNAICTGESTQLFSNAGGGSGNYTYEWSSVPAGNPPWTSSEANPVISPDTTTIYLLDLYDGFTPASSSPQRVSLPSMKAVGKGNTSTFVPPRAEVNPS
jgi:hypothetical protein